MIGRLATTASRPAGDVALARYHGLVQLCPFMECYHGVLSLDHAVRPVYHRRRRGRFSRRARLHREGLGRSFSARMDLDADEPFRAHGRLLTARWRIHGWGQPFAASSSACCAMNHHTALPPTRRRVDRLEVTDHRVFWEMRPRRAWRRATPGVRFSLVAHRDKRGRSAARTDAHRHAAARVRKPDRAGRCHTERRPRPCACRRICRARPARRVEVGAWTGPRTVSNRQSVLALPRAQATRSPFWRAFTQQAILSAAIDGACASAAGWRKVQRYAPAEASPTCTICAACSGSTPGWMSLRGGRSGASAVPTRRSVARRRHCAPGSLSSVRRNPCISGRESPEDGEADK